MTDTLTKIDLRTQPTHRGFAELDWATDYALVEDNRAAIVGEARRWAEEQLARAYRGSVKFDYAEEQLIVLVQDMRGPHTGWPVVRFDGSIVLVAALVQAFEDEADGVSDGRAWENGANVDPPGARV